jgi:hypothetical protein
MLEKERDIQGVVNITPDHQHGSINIAALRKGKAAISHKPVASVLYECGEPCSGTRQQRRVAPPRLQQQSRSATRWRRGSTRRRRRGARSAQLDEPAVLAAGHAGLSSGGTPYRMASTGRCGRGPEPERPYHPSYTFAVYRGWYAYGTGCLATWGTTACGSRTASSISAYRVGRRPSEQRRLGQREKRQHGGRVSTIGLPRASVVRWRHPATAARPAVDTFWYDGGMKPQTPDELYADNEDLADEGMLIVGDKGKILCDFRGNAPRLIPRSRQQAFSGTVAVPEFDSTNPEDEWVNAIKSAKKSRGSFEESRRSPEAVTLANIALRVPYKRLLWDSARMEFTNSAEANKFVRREEYRTGWETPHRIAPCCPRKGTPVASVTC